MKKCGRNRLIDLIESSRGGAETLMASFYKMLKEAESVIVAESEGKELVHSRCMMEYLRTKRGFIEECTRQGIDCGHFLIQDITESPS
ncbi:MAG: hypothetical protein WCC74_02325 [Minisyncoccia bacterium]